jgi:hypothetical protein
MPDREAPKEQNAAGHSARLLRALIWAGVSLAPVAAAVVLLGATDAAERFAIVVMAVCVVLIGGSMLVRSDPVLLRMDVEDRVAAEIDGLREDLREEFAAAARATHHRVQTLQEEIGRLRNNAFAAVSPPPTGGRVLAASAPGWPESSEAAGAARPPAAPRPATPAARPAAAVRPAGPAHRPAGSAARQAAPRPSAAAPIPSQRGQGSAVVPPPPMAPVFRPPTVPPQRDSGIGSTRRPAGPPPGQYGKPRQQPDSTGYDGPPGYEPGYDGPPGYGGSPRYDDAPGGGGSGYSDSAGYADSLGYGGATYGDSGGYRDGPGHGDGGRYGEPAGGKRRADVTAVDLGYTGRRSRPDHMSPDHMSPDHMSPDHMSPDGVESDPIEDSGEFDYGPDQDAGYPGYSWEQASGGHERHDRW